MATNNPNVPAVSIGLPVYNGARSIRKALDSLLAQTFTDFELIISDNGSTDGTEAICREYAAADQRIRYVRHPQNLGAGANFKFVFDEARARYFTWAACDDWRSSDFIEVNFNFLEKNSDYVASTCPNGFEGSETDTHRFYRFALDGDACDRFNQFFDNCWMSHGIFYSLIRTDVLRDCRIIGQQFLAGDWAIDLFLASRGKVNRTQQGYMIFGVHGISRSRGAHKVFRQHAIEVIFPLVKLTQYVFSLAREFPLRRKLGLAFVLLKLNLEILFLPVRSILYFFYATFVKPLRSKTSEQRS